MIKNILQNVALNDFRDPRDSFFRIPSSQPSLGWYSRTDMYYLLIVQQYQHYLNILSQIIIIIRYVVQHSRKLIICLKLTWKERTSFPARNAKGRMIGNSNQKERKYLITRERKYFIKKERKQNSSNCDDSSLYELNS